MCSHIRLALIDCPILYAHGCQLIPKRDLHLKLHNLLTKGSKKQETKNKNPSCCSNKTKNKRFECSETRVGDAKQQLLLRMILAGVADDSSSIFYIYEYGKHTYIASRTFEGSTKSLFYFVSGIKTQF